MELPVVAYIVKTKSGEFGPLEEAEVKALATTGQLQPDDLIRPANSSQWRPARAVKGYVAPASSPSPSGSQRSSAKTAGQSRQWIPIVVTAAVCSVVTGLGVWAVTFLTSASPNPTPLRPDSSVEVWTEEPLPESGAALTRRSEFPDVPPEAITADQLAESARTAARNGDPESAVAQYREALEVDPDRNDIRLQLAETLASADLPLEAIAEYRIILEDDPNDMSAWLGMGDAAIQTGEAEMVVAGIAAWERARVIAPEDQTILLKLLLVYEQANMVARFIPVAEAYVGEFLGDSVENRRPSLMQLAAMTSLASAYSIEGRTSDSELTYRTVLRYDDSSDAARNGLSGLLLAREAYEEASRILDEIEEPTADSEFMRTRVAVARGDLSTAASTLRSSLELDAANADRWYFLAAIEFDRERVLQAVEATERAIAIDGDKVDYRVLRARSLLKANRDQEALREASQVEAKGGEAGVVSELRGLALAGLGRTREAETALRDAMRLRPSAEAGIALTDLLEDRKAWMESASVYAQLESLQPDSAIHWRRWRANMHVQEASSRYQAGDLNGAIRHRRTSVELDPSDSNKARLAGVLGLKVLELLGVDDFRGARQYNQELARFDRQEAAKLGRMIDEHESLQRQIDTPQPVIADPPVTRGTVESRIVTDFDGLEHGNIYELQNGQIWKQTDFYIWIRIAVYPRVIIYRDGASWKMKVDGIDRAVRVERIR